MTSSSGSAFEPSSVMTCPFTVTRPALIKSSAWRRDATPACARIFWRRSCIPLLLHFLGYFFFCSGLTLDEFLEFLHRRQVAEVFQAEMDEEFLGGFVEDGTAKHFFAPGSIDEFLVEKRFDDPAG